MTSWSSVDRPVTRRSAWRSCRSADSSVWLFAHVAIHRDTRRPTDLSRLSSGGTASHASSTSMSATSTAGPVSTTSVGVPGHLAGPAGDVDAPGRAVGADAVAVRRWRRQRRRCRCRRTASPPRLARAPASAGAAGRHAPRTRRSDRPAAPARRPAARLRSRPARSSAVGQLPPRRAGWGSAAPGPCAGDSRRGGDDRPVGKEPGQSPSAQRRFRPRWLAHVRIPPRVATAASAQRGRRGEGTHRRHECRYRTSRRCCRRRCGSP